MFRKTLDSAVAGDNVGALLRGVDRKETSNVVKYWLNQVPSTHTQNSKQKYTY